MALTQVQPGMLGTPQPYNFKNRIINGPMTVSQRNGTASATFPSDTYTLDRWFASGYGTGSNSATVQQLSASPPTGFTNYLQVASGSTSATNIFLSQSIETLNCAGLAGQNVTVSFWYKIPVNWTNQWQVSLTWSTSADTAVKNSATGNGSGSFSWGSGVTQNTTLANTSTWTKASFTYAVPSNAQTIGVCFTNGFSNTVNGAQFQLAGVQLELGATATDFDYRPYGTELALCQRYFQRITPGTGRPFSGSITQNSTAWCQFPTKATMRIAPSVTDSNPTLVTVSPGGNNVAVYFGGYVSFSGITYQSTGPDFFNFAPNGIATVTNGQGVTIDTGPNFYINLSSEL